MRVFDPFGGGTPVTADFFTAVGATVDTNDANSGTVTVTFPATAKNPITLPNLGLTAPVAGATRSPAISTTAEYTGTVSWSPELVNNKFAGNTVYTATITVTPTTDYTLDGVTENFFKVTGASATNIANSGTVIVTFPATDYITITNGTISSLTAPVTGEVPDTTITETDEYTASVSWNPSNNPFAASTQYTATITITPKSGYTYSGLASNFFTVGGVNGTFNNSTGVIVVTFPATGAAMDTRDIEDINFGFVMKYQGVKNSRPYYRVLKTEDPNIFFDETILEFDAGDNRWEFNVKYNGDLTYSTDSYFNSNSVYPPNTGDEGKSWTNDYYFIYIFKN